MTVEGVAPEPEPWLRLRDLTKSYGGVTVLRDVAWDLLSGRVYGLVGENGAGKSTLAKIVAGVVRADDGAVEVDGVALALRAPRDALAHGITIISQELSLVPARTVTENVALGSGAHPLSIVRDRTDQQRLARLQERVGFDVDRYALVGDLSVGQRQQVEILRALGQGARLVIMDEPTAALSAPETAKLLAIVRRLADSDTTVVLVSHFLDEVLEVCDEVVVLRDGEVVHTGPARTETQSSLVRHMVGRPLDIVYPEPPPLPDDAPVVLEARGLRRGSVVGSIDLHVRRGEIVGLFGLIGAGRSETARLLFGADRSEGGRMLLHGEPYAPRNPRAAMRRGVAMVPEDRKSQGLVLVRPLRENVSLANLEQITSAGVLRGAREEEMTRAAVRETDVRGSDPEGPVWALSGGNQQKVLFGRWLRRRPDLLIVDEPTRGVDIAAKVGIHRLLHRLAEKGTAVLMISSEVEEVLGLAHRVVVMRRGEVVSEYARGGADPESVLAAAFGAGETGEPRT